MTGRAFCPVFRRHAHSELSSYMHWQNPLGRDAGDSPKIAYEQGCNCGAQMMALIVELFSFFCVEPVPKRPIFCEGSVSRNTPHYGSAPRAVASAAQREVRSLQI